MVQNFTCNNKSHVQGSTQDSNLQLLSLIHLLAVLATEIYQVLDDMCFSDLGSSYFAADAMEEDKAAEID